MSIEFATHCNRNSGVASTSTRVGPYEINTEGRVRLSCGSVEEQTGQWHPIIGMPADVPVPRKRISMPSILDISRHLPKFRPARKSGEPSRHPLAVRKPHVLR